MKKIIKMLLLLSFVVVLTGCMKMNMKITVSEDLTMTGKVDMLFQESFLKTMGMTKEEAISSMKKSMQKDNEDYQIEEIEETIDGETWAGLSMTSDELYNMDAQDVLTKDGQVIKMKIPMDELNKEINEQGFSDLAGSGYSVETLKNAGVEMNLIIEMPGKVTANVGKVEGNTVTIDLLDMINENNIDYIEIEADLTQSTNDNTMLYIGIGVAIIVVLLIVGLAVKNKKKNKMKKETVQDNLSSLHHQDDDIRFCPHCGCHLNGEEICPQCHQRVK